MRRAAVACLASVIVATGAACGADEPAVATPPSAVVVVRDLAPLIVANGARIYQYVDNRAETLHELADGEAILAMSSPDADGMLVHRVSNDRGSVLLVHDEKETVLVDDAGLLDAGFIDEQPSFVYTRCDYDAEDGPQGDVVIRRLASNTERRLTFSCAPEYGVSRASYGGGVFVVSATSDLTEVFRFYEPDGTEIEGRPNPTEDLPYNEPPFMTEAVLSGDGSTLAYLEAPDVSGVAGGGDERAGSWQVVVLDQRSGKETLRVKLAAPAEHYQRLDYDGRWIVLSQGEDEPIRVVDADAEVPEPIEVDGVDGIASIMRS